MTITINGSSEKIPLLLFYLLSHVSPRFGSRAGRFGRFAQLTTQPPFGSSRTEFVIFSVPGIRKIRRICIDARYEIWSAVVYAATVRADNGGRSPITSPYYFIKPVDT